jgi:hypothetical protein
MEHEKRNVLKYNPKDGCVMKTLASLMLAGSLVFAFGQSGYAQTSPPATPAAPKAPAMPKAMAMPDDPVKKAKAKECSAQADAQKLHGKARKEFREKCKKS